MADANQQEAQEPNHQEAQERGQQDQANFDEFGHMDNYYDNGEEVKDQIPPVVDFGQGNQAPGHQNNLGRNQNHVPE